MEGDNCKNADCSPKIVSEHNSNLMQKFQRNIKVTQNKKGKPKITFKIQYSFFSFCQASYNKKSIDWKRNKQHKAHKHSITTLSHFKRRF